MDVIGHRGQPLGDRPEFIELEGIHGQVAERCQDLNNVGLAVVVCVFSELGVTGRVPVVVKVLALSYMLWYGFGCGPEAGEVVRVSSRPACHRACLCSAPPGSWRCPAISSLPILVGACPAASRTGHGRACVRGGRTQQRLAAVGQPITDGTKTPAAAMFNHD